MKPNIILILLACLAATMAAAVVANLAMHRAGKAPANIPAYSVRNANPVRPARTTPTPVMRTPNTAPTKTIAPSPPSEFDKEALLSPRQLLVRWDPLVVAASKKFGVPETWLRAVMEAESGGRTMAGEKQKIVSSAGAMGLMQLMPETYDEMRRTSGLGHDPFDPHDNIFAAAAYLRWLRGRYGYPAMFAAYNDGPGNLEARLAGARLLPAETDLYVAEVTQNLESGRLIGGGRRGVMLKFTRPNGQPVWIDGGAVISVRAALPGEYAPGVQSVIEIGRLKQGVRESVAMARHSIRGRRA